jgi:hypothetical protein
MQEFTFTVQLPDWWFVRRSPVLQLNYFVRGLYKGVQFYSVTKRLEASCKTSVLQCNY